VTSNLVSKGGVLGMKSMRRVLGIFLTTFALLLAFASVAAGSGAEDAFSQKINHERSTRSLHSLSWDSGLVDIARAHSKRMATEHRLFHNTSLPNQVKEWNVLGENVGRGPSIDAIHEAFMASPTHHAQIVATDYKSFAVGTFEADGEIWVTEIFVLRPPGYSPAAAVKASTARKPRPAVKAAAPIAPAPEPAPPFHANLELISASESPPPLRHYLIQVPRSIGLFIVGNDGSVLPLGIATALLLGGVALAQGLAISGKRGHEMTAITSPS
jgi:hypothetical protein